MIRRPACLQMMNWFASLCRILAVLVLAALVGWHYGYLMEAIVLTLLAINALWLHQMMAAIDWLQNPSKSIPGIGGIWGNLLAKIYANRRKHQKERVRLQAKIDYLQGSLASMRDGVVMVDESGMITWLNRSAEPLLGLRYPEDTGQTLTNLVRTPKFNHYFMQGDYREPLQYVTHDNNKMHLRVEITRFGKGERLLFIQDVSLSARMEQIRRDFVANVSHELRTPLTVINGYLSTFLSSPDNLPPHLAKPCQQMSQQATRMENLIKELLWLSRIENEELEEKRECVDMADLLQELTDDMSTSHPEYPITLNLINNSTIQGDFRELYSAISNLVTNAIKYSKKGSPVTIHWETKGNSAKLKVSDNGIGIDRLHIPRLTERFYRVDSSRHAATGGTGLGLAIVKHVAVSHEAQLHIESEPGKGSTFTLEFPVKGK